jgi:hypothetical protein
MNRRIAELIPAIDEHGEKFSFRHPLIRDALYDEISTSYPIRAAWHQDAAEALAEVAVPIWGGPATPPRQLELHIAPVILGGGARLLDNVGSELRLEQVRTVEAPGVTHVKYRVVR